ncbi:hypothetical protein SAMN02927900_00064 [Rhizobium mongolense subsp. loessense]|uniref:Uncharacterized protein n=1 Tax=Rhizobium mongolense subsp. loessense TaxID=158890 RepID=A0A1G4P6S3_9HYPH|nr:hypothetical protein [Rhizobium mongolense]SCW27943.1 hypothetical protein SAMN02927900_00064 [Rhizobium mongolense subsp. loessense]
MEVTNGIIAFDHHGLAGANEGGHLVIPGGAARSRESISIRSARPSYTDARCWVLMRSA